MKKILAVSGGLDSVVLLHHFKDDPSVIVAHFNHGTRPSALDDQLFVERLARQYDKPFFTGAANLGPTTSEELARNARYNFLLTLAKQHTAKIITAHHADDLLETVTINLLRGTGWRGLAPFGRDDIERPLLNLTKNQLRQYAAEHQLSYREDPTNHEDYYLRNRVRERLLWLDASTSAALIRLAQRQVELRDQINDAVAQVLPVDNFYQRSWFKDMDNHIAIEILQSALKLKNISATRPQLQEFLSAIRTYAPGKQFNLPGDRLVKLHKDHFML